jgi:heavy metal efflux system protein
MNLGGIPARLLSLGTIDFGIIVNGAILMTEAILSQSEARFGESFTEDILGPRDKRK